VERLAALVPPPRFHIARYHGILGPCASARERVVPGIVPREDEAVLSTCKAHGERRRAHLGAAAADRPPSADAASDLAEQRAFVASGSAPHRNPAVAPKPHVPPDAAPRPRRISWSELLRRVFAVDVLRCPDCGSRMRILATIHPPEATQAILTCLGLPVRAPPIPAARPEDLEAVERWADHADALPPDDFDA